MCVHHIGAVLSTSESMYYQLMHELYINCNYIQSHGIGTLNNMLLACRISTHLQACFLIVWLPLPFNPEKRQGWRDGGAVSVKEEEEKIKWQGGYEMCA